MAVSTKPSDGIQVAVNGSAVTEAGTQPFDNTHTIVILNNTASVDGFVNWQADTTRITATTGSVVPGGASLTLNVGPKSSRPASANTLRFDAGSAVNFQVTYVNGNQT